MKQTIILIALCVWFTDSDSAYGQQKKISGCVNFPDNHGPITINCGGRKSGGGAVRRNIFVTKKEYDCDKQKINAAFSDEDEKIYALQADNKALHTEIDAMRVELNNHEVRITSIEQQLVDMYWRVNQMVNTYSEQQRGDAYQKMLTEEEVRKYLRSCRRANTWMCITNGVMAVTNVFGVVSLLGRVPQNIINNYVTNGTTSMRNPHRHHQSHQVTPNGGDHLGGYYQTPQNNVPLANGGYSSGGTYLEPTGGTIIGNINHIGGK